MKKSSCLLLDIITHRAGKSSVTYYYYMVNDIFQDRFVWWSLLNGTRNARTTLIRRYGASCDNVASAFLCREKLRFIKIKHTYISITAMRGRQRMSAVISCVFYLQIRTMMMSSKFKHSYDAAFHSNVHWPISLYMMCV